MAIAKLNKELVPMLFNKQNQQKNNTKILRSVDILPPILGFGFS